jgi:NAD(P)H dehydrogenase (quinone)
LGEATATILTTNGHENKTYNLTGTTAYSFADVATTLSELTGKAVAYNSPEPAAFEAMLKQFGLPEGIVLMSVLFAAGAKNGDFDLPSSTLEQLLGRKTTDLKTFLKAAYSA